MEIVKLDILDGRGEIAVAVSSLVEAERLRKFMKEINECKEFDPMNETYLAGYSAGVAAEREAYAVEVETTSQDADRFKYAGVIRDRSNVCDNRPPRNGD